MIILFGIGYKANNIYYNLCLKRIYNRLREKNSNGNDEENNETKSASKLMKKNVYKSIERISMSIIYLIY